MSHTDRLVYCKMADKAKEKYNQEIQEFETMEEPVPTKKRKKNSDYKLKEVAEVPVEEEVEKEMEEEEMEEEEFQCDREESESDSGLIEESTVRMDIKEKRPRARRGYGREEVYIE